MKGVTAGFTVIELAIVISMIAVLSAIGIPKMSAYLATAETADFNGAARPAMAAVEQFYAYRGRFPRDNTEAALPPPEVMATRNVERVTVEAGAVQLYLRANRLWDQLASETMWISSSTKVLSLRPTVLDANPTASIIWICSDKILPGRTVHGTNRMRFGPAEGCPGGWGGV